MPWGAFQKTMVLQALLRESQLKWQTVTKYIQKPPVPEETSNEANEMAVDEEKVTTPKRLTQTEYDTQFTEALN